MHRRRSAVPSLPACCAILVPATQSQAYGRMVVPTPLLEQLTPSSHAWRGLRAHTHTPTARTDTPAHTLKHTPATLRDGRILDGPPMFPAAHLATNCG